MKDLAFLIKRLSDALERIANQQLELHGLTLAQARILGHLASMGGYAAQKELEIHLGVSHPTVVGLVHRLKAKGFVETIRDTRGHNAKGVRLLPPKDIPISGELERMTEDIGLRLTQGMSQAEQDSLARLLERMLKNLED